MTDNIDRATNTVVVIIGILFIAVWVVAVLIAMRGL